MLLCSNYSWLFWNFLKLLSCGSKFNHSHFGHGFVSTVMCVSNHRVSFLYFYINMIPFVYLFLRGFTFAYVMGYGILQSLPHAGISFFFVPPDASYSWLYSLGSLRYNALSWWVGVGGSQIVGWLLHPSSHKSCLGLSPCCFCTQSFGIFQNANWLKTTATTKSSELRWSWKTPGSTAGLGTAQAESPELWSYTDYSHRVWSWKWSVSYVYTYPSLHEEDLKGNLLLKIGPFLHLGLISLSSSIFLYTAVYLDVW